MVENKPQIAITFSDQVIVSAAFLQSVLHARRHSRRSHPGFQELIPISL
jgi:hypothetical protein